jgi:hypothetical protein
LRSVLSRLAPRACAVSAPSASALLANHASLAAISGGMTRRADALASPALCAVLDAHTALLGALEALGRSDEPVPTWEGVAAQLADTARRFVDVARPRSVARAVEVYALQPALDALLDIAQALAGPHAVMAGVELAAWEPGDPALLLVHLNLGFDPRTLRTGGRDSRSAGVAVVGPRSAGDACHRAILARWGADERVSRSARERIVISCRPYRTVDLDGSLV